MGIATHAVSSLAKVATGGIKWVLSTLRGAIATGTRTAETAIDSTQSAVDPMQLAASYLQPIQAMLHYYLRPLRGVHGLLTWHDPALSSWLCLVIFFQAIMLPFLPWVLISHGVGLAVLGPHMWILGARQRRAAKIAAAAAAAAANVAQNYHDASASQKERIVRAERLRRQAVEAEAQEAEAKLLASLPHAAHAAHRKSYGEVVRVQASRVRSTKYMCLPDPTRSRAKMLTASDGDADS